MFNRQRADYLLLFVQQHNESKGMNTKAVSYPIAGIPNYILGHFMCANTKQMAEVIGTINTILNQLYRDETLLDAHVNGLRKGELTDFYRYFQQAFVVD